MVTRGIELEENAYGKPEREGCLKCIDVLLCGSFVMCCFAEYRWRYQFEPLLPGRRPDEFLAELIAMPAAFANADREYTVQFGNAVEVGEDAESGAVGGSGMRRAGDGYDEGMMDR